MNGNHYLGYLADFPDYMTQGESEEDLKSHLLDLYKELSENALPYIRRIDELVVAL
jgi:predicted RNase H-like HicB family nuclease